MIAGISYTNIPHQLSILKVTNFVGNKIALRMQQHTTIAPKSEIMDKNTSKRSKINNEISLSIDDLNARKAGNNFQGDHSWNQPTRSQAN
ncbi:hypothetical protein SUGI_1202510 [Cryptomeria japonica]|nr:hypothetical protein SUGI_1202510 [Cryptomeria japonica]